MKEETQKGICILGFIAVLFTTVARGARHQMMDKQSEITWAHSEALSSLEGAHLKAPW